MGTVPGKNVTETPEASHSICKIWLHFMWTKRGLLTYHVFNVAKGAIFEKLRFSIINLTMKKLHKLDELGIEG